MDTLDFTGPFEVFNTCQRLWIQQADTPLDQAFKVTTIAEKQGETIARGGLRFIAENGIDYHPHIDILIVPGGIIASELNKEKIISWIRTTTERADITTSVGTGTFLLAKAGILDGIKATTHRENIEELSSSYRNIEVMDNRRLVDEGHIITSGGGIAGIDMSLYLIKRITGHKHALRTARQMEYEWRE